MMREDQRHDEIDSSLAELRDLLADFATGELTDEQDARLQQLSIESKAAWRLYIDYMFMYGTIQRKHCNREKVQSLFATLFGDTEVGEKEVGEKEVDNTEEGAQNASSSNSSIFPLLEIEKDLLSSPDVVDEFGAGPSSGSNNASPGGFFGNINFSFVPGLITIISSMLILSVVLILPIYWTTRPEPKWNLAALITKTVDCQWKPGGIKPSAGSFLTLGQKLELELGLAELEFASGAKVILEGPAEFTIVGENSSRLTLGRVAATVPEGAEGFVVETPDLEVVDLGTEFGIAVDGESSTGVHVFKGVVETEIASLPESQKQDSQSSREKKRRKFRLEENHAVQYDKIEDSVVPIPVDKKAFVRTLDRGNGVTPNLRVTNPSFELPDIRTVPEYQAVLGSTLHRPIYGWKVSDINPSKSTVATYQISPYSPSSGTSNVGPGASDGRQVAAISLGVKSSSFGKPRSNWIYQSLGVVTSADFGKTLKLSVDAAPRRAYGGLPHGDGSVFAGFAVHVTPEQNGKIVGNPGSFQQGADEVKGLHRLRATLTITPELVGQELFILLAVGDRGKNKDVHQYHFDNVEVTVED